MRERQPALEQQAVEQNRTLCTSTTEPVRGQRRGSRPVCHTLRNTGRVIKQKIFDDLSGFLTKPAAPPLARTYARRSHLRSRGSRDAPFLFGSMFDEKLQIYDYRGRGVCCRGLCNAGSCADRVIESINHGYAEGALIALVALSLTSQASSHSHAVVSANILTFTNSNLTTCGERLEGHAHERRACGLVLAKAGRFTARERPPCRRRSVVRALRWTADVITLRLYGWPVNFGLFELVGSCKNRPPLGGAAGQSGKGNFHG